MAGLPAKPDASAADGETIDDVEDDVVEDAADAEIAENALLLQERMYTRTKLTVPFHRFLRNVEKCNNIELIRTSILPRSNSITSIFHKFL